MKLRLFRESKGIKHTGLQSRFLFRVLLPPFFVLVIVSLTGFVVFSSSVRDSETANLQRTAVATAAKLEREFALRQVILENTGNELFAIKKEQQTIRKDLENNYNKCRKYITTDDDFTSAPDDACRPFYSQFAVALQKNTNPQAAINAAYTERTDEFLAEEQAAVNNRLKEYVKFFPETTTLLITDEEQGVISSVVSGDSSSTAYLERIADVANKALKEPVEALATTDGNTRQMVFAYPIEGGSVLAAYDLDNAEFLYTSWKSAPIDNSKAYIVIADSASKTSYPKLKDDTLYRSAMEASNATGRADFSSSSIDYLATSEPIGKTGWFVIVSSPTAIALESLANTQILAVLVAGVLLVSFIWMGSVFIKRTVGSILGLVGGAVVFSSGGLNHRIDTTKMSDKEFSQLADTMNHMAVKIQDAEAAIDRKNKEFISVATHEIKAPITAIIGNLSMMLDDGMGTIDDMARNLSTQAYSGTIRLRNLVNELLDIARLESGSTRFDLESIDLVKTVRDMIEIQKTPAAEKGIGIEYFPSVDKPTAVLVDKTKLEIILTNFISNGIKYNRQAGKLTVRHEITGGQVQVMIQDTGLGIPAEQQAQMFQKFFRVEGTDRVKIPGTGLGMFITKQFIEGMGGKLWFESEHGKGTTFYFTLPLVTAENQPPPPVTRST